MKRIFRIREQGKVKEVGRRALATVPGTDHLESNVALIQALIPLGLQAVAEVLKEEIIALAGERDRRVGGQPGVVRGTTRVAPSTWRARNSRSRIPGSATCRCSARRSRPRSAAQRPRRTLMLRKTMIGGRFGILTRNGIDSSPSWEACSLSPRCFQKCCFLERRAF